MSLNAGTTYRIRIRSVNASGDGPWSAEIAKITLPAIPTSLAAGAATGDSIPLTFTGVTGAASYTIGYKKGSDDEETASVTGSPYTLTGLDSGSSYTIRIRAVNAAGNGAWSATITASTLATLAAPSDLAAGTATSDTIPLTWTAVAGATGYKIGYTPASGSETVVTVAGGTTASHSLTGLDASTTYSIRIRTTNSAGDGAWSGAVSATTAVGATLGAISGLAEMAQGFVSSLVAFNFPNGHTIGAGAYAMEIRTGRQKLQVRHWRGRVLLGLVAGEHGLLREIQSRSGSGRSLRPLGIPRHGRVGSTGVAAKATSLSITSPTERGFTVGWTNPASNIYNVVYCLDQSSGELIATFPSSVGPGAQSLTVTNLRPGRTYTVLLTNTTSGNSGEVLAATASHATSAATSAPAAASTSPSANVIQQRWWILWTDSASSTSVHDRHEG